MKFEKQYRLNYNNYTKQYVFVFLTNNDTFVFLVMLQTFLKD